MIVNQMYSFLNDINRQMFGQDAITVNDASGIISMGKNVLGDGHNTELFLNKLYDRIGKVVVRTLGLEADFPSLYMDSYSFGCILQKITIRPIEAKRNSSWDIGRDDFKPTMLDINKFDAIVTYFTDVDSWSFPVTIPSDTMLKTAFIGEAQMGAFLDGVMSAMTDSAVRSFNNMSRTAINNFVAEKVKAANGVINLLAEYNTLFSASLTPETAMVNKDFLRYAVKQIRQYIKYLEKESVLYNVGDGSGGPVNRRTSRQELNVFCLSAFVGSVESYLESDSFHKDLVSLPNFTEVTHWQANLGEDTSVNDFATNSAIKIIPSSENNKQNPQDVEQGGIICVMADRRGIAVGLNDRRTASFYNPIDNYTNMKEEATMQYINDMSENGVIFIVAGSEGTLDDLTVKAANGTYYDVATSTYQTGITVEGGKVKGTLKFLEGGISPSGPLSGDGYFLALSLYDSHSEIEAMGDVKVGLQPSAGTGLVSIKGDVDDVIVMKISDKDQQKFKVVSTKTGYNTNVQTFDLSELKLKK